MKTQVVQLDPHDDIISTRDKLGWKQTGRVLLVWPSKGRVLTRRVDLVLLTRHAASLGAQLALVSRDPQVKENAASLGISVFDSTDQAQTARWERPRHWRRRLARHHVSAEELYNQRAVTTFHTPAWLNRPYIRLLIFACGVAAVLAIAALLLPAAEIHLEPEVVDQQLELAVRASTQVEAVNISGLLPIEAIPVEVEGRDILPVTGITPVPAEKASGEVTFTNLGVTSITIPGGTIVRTIGADPKRFATTRSTRLGAGPNTQVSVPVEAIDAGAQGNLAPNRLVAIEGPLGIELRVTNERPTRGGTLRNVPSVSRADQQALSDRLLDTLRQSAAEEFFASTWKSDLLLTPTPRLVNIVTEDYSAEVGEPADQLELTLRAQFEFQVVPQAAIEALANQALDANLAEGFQPLPDTLEISHLEYPVLGPDGQASWEIQVYRAIQQWPDRIATANLAAGRTPEEVRQQLSTSIDLKKQPEIFLLPAWWPRLPYLPFRIQVSIRG